MSGPLQVSKIERAVTSHVVDIGGAKVTLPFAKNVCNFGATYTDDMTGDSRFSYDGVLLEHE